MLSDIYEMMYRDKYAETHEFETPEDEAEYQRFIEEQEVAITSTK